MKLKLVFRGLLFLFTIPLSVILGVHLLPLGWTMIQFENTLKADS
jgi:hypothetical protein